MSHSFNFRNASKGSIFSFSYPCNENKCECYPLVGKFPPGIYLLELYGAEGGKINEYHGGKGGYSKGVLTIEQYTDAYLYIGAQGETTSEYVDDETCKSFGGGGFGKRKEGGYATGGGGATDIRLFNDDLYHRVIVAGGGGGAGNYLNEYRNGGDGGGLVGGSASMFEHANKITYAGFGGGQTGNEEYFGKGGDYIPSDGSGGGGGWYGGTGGYGYSHPGGGGSGFVFNITNKDIASQANLQLPDSVLLISSDTSKTDHYGDGFIQITVIDLNKIQITCNKSRNFIHIVIFILITIVS